MATYQRSGVSPESETRRRAGAGRTQRHWSRALGPAKLPLGHEAGRPFRPKGEGDRGEAEVGRNAGT